MQVAEHKRQVIIQLVVLSALVLFTELVIIRWLSAYILTLSYFSNIILIASFFGLGLGTLMGPRRRDWFMVFPILLAAIVLLVFILKIDLVTQDANLLFFRGIQPGTALQLPLEIVGIAVYIIVGSLFVPLGQRLARLLNSLPPLQAYSWDIVGALLGIAFYTLLAFLETSPLVWFMLIGLVVIWLIPDKQKRLMATVVFGLIFYLLASLTQATQWSPYYKLTLAPIDYPNSAEQGWTLLANQTGHQTLELPEYKEAIYQLPYVLMEGSDLGKILIIGSGGGSDTAVALERSSGEVTAVEIDPVILRLGQELHPSDPYASARVKTIVNDGRAYLEQTDERYDLIIFALTDSLTLASTYTNTRLESYLFTLESFKAAAQRLSDQGILVLYNYYRQPWLIQKLGGMLATVFEEPPYILSDEQSLAALVAGPGLAALTLPETGIELTEIYEPATDSWPFLYLKRPYIPSLYIAPLILILLVSLGSILWAQRTLLKRSFRWHFFWLGAGFLLLETKNVVNFSLLFGATWLVNALVFFAILLAVLLANFIIQRHTPKSSRWIYAGLALVLIINLLVPLKSLFIFGTVGRYALAALLTFTPIVLANLIFARSFLKTPQANLAFGANLLGAVFGGFLEYSSLVIGYHYLVVLIGVLYFMSWLTVTGRFRLRL